MIPMNEALRTALRKSKLLKGVCGQNEVEALKLGDAPSG
jgi:hypothetical protein